MFIDHLALLSFTHAKQIKDVIEEHRTGIHIASGRSLDRWKLYYDAQVRSLIKWRADNPDVWQSTTTSLAEDVL